MSSKKYDIQYTKKFRKQYEKISKNGHFKMAEFEKVIGYLHNNEVLPVKYHNHLLNPKSERCVGMSYSARCFIGISKVWWRFSVNSFNYWFSF